MNDLAEYKELKTLNDLVKVTDQALVGLIIPKSRSNYYGLCLEMAQGADYYGTYTVGKDCLAMAAYNNHPASINRANLLLQYCNSWKGLICYVGQRQVRASFAYMMLVCYAKALQCTDKHAHCCQIVHDPFNRGKDNLYLLPCHKLSPWKHKLTKYHPSTQQDQIQALAVFAGCDFCPLFDANLAQEVKDHPIIKT